MRLVKSNPPAKRGARTESLPRLQLETGEKTMRNLPLNQHRVDRLKPVSSRPLSRIGEPSQSLSLFFLTLCILSRPAECPHCRAYALSIPAVTKNKESSHASVPLAKCSTARRLRAGPLTGPLVQGYHHIAYSRRASGVMPIESDPISLDTELA